MILQANQNITITVITDDSFNPISLVSGQYMSLDLYDGETIQIISKELDSVYGDNSYSILINEGGDEVVNPGSVPRPYYTVTGAKISRPNQTTIGLINQTTVFEEYLRHTFTPVESDNYKIGGFYEHSINSTSVNFISSVELRRSSDDLLLRTIQQKNQEQKDSDGTGISLNRLQGGIILSSVNTGTDQRFDAKFENDIFLEKDVEVYCNIRWRGQSNNQEVAIYNACIWADQKTIYKP